MADSAVPGASARLVESSWPALRPGLSLLVPVGSVEQHGPHLPLDVDTVIAVAVCEAVAQRVAAGVSRERSPDASSRARITPEARSDPARSLLAPADLLASAVNAAGDAGAAVGGEWSGEVKIAPAVAYGASGEHEDFPGTVSIGTDALAATLVELGRSARRWARGILFVNGHGGNVDAVTRAVQALEAEDAAVAWVPCRSGEEHAGRGETSLMLHLAPQRVRFDAAEAGVGTPVTDLLSRLRAEGVRAVSPNGVLGDPRGATADEGAALLERMTAEVTSALDGLRRR